MTPPQSSPTAKPLGGPLKKRLHPLHPLLAPGSVALVGRASVLVHSAGWCAKA